jgi:hypothetical protein
MKGNKEVLHRSCLMALLFSGFIFGSEVARLRADDIVIQNHKGDLKRRNPSGGFVLDRIDGDCDVSSSGGSIRATAVTGNMTAFTERGDIEINDVRGKVNAISKGGNVNIKNVRGGIYAETLMGEITVQSAKRVEAVNILGGDIKIIDVAGYSNVKSNGNILLIIADIFSESRVCDLSSTDGDIVICMPGNAAADIEIRMPIAKETNKETRIESDYSLKKFDQKLIEEGKTLLITTTINGGGKKIGLNINKGNIYFRIKE